MTAFVSATIDEAGKLHLELDEAARDQLVGSLQRLSVDSSELHLEIAPRHDEVLSHSGSARLHPPVIRSATFRLQDSLEELYLPHLLRIPWED